MNTTQTPSARGGFGQLPLRPSSGNETTLDPEEIRSRHFSDNSFRIAERGELISPGSKPGRGLNPPRNPLFTEEKKKIFRLTSAQNIITGRRSATFERNNTISRYLRSVKTFQSDRPPNCNYPRVRHRKPLRDDLHQLRMHRKSKCLNRFGHRATVFTGQ